MEKKETEEMKFSECVYLNIVYIKRVVCIQS